MNAVANRQMDGPRSIYRAPDEGIAARADYPNAPVDLVLERSTPGAELFVEMLAIDGSVPLHNHPVFGFRYVASVDADGVETAIGPGGCVLSPAGPSGAHAYRSVGDMPLQMLVVFPSANGYRPRRTVVDITS